MSDQQETTANTNQPRLCKMGCGFFGSNATGDCCSKCWKQSSDRDNKTEEKPPAPTAPTIVEECVEAAPAPEPEAAPVAPVVPETKPSVEEAKSSSPAVESKATASTAATVTKKKKKKKKATYKNMMADMMKGDGRDTQKEKEDLRKVTGGGAFSKIEKI